MIVVISHDQDVHARRVMERLAGWGRPAYLYDLAQFPHRATLSIDYADLGAPRLRVRHRDHGVVDLADATAVWWRRPQFVDMSAVTDDDARGFTYGEWHEALNGLNQLLTCPWMNPPANDEAASRKAGQLPVAHRLGLRVPATLMTSDPDEARAFVERHGIGRTIYKIFSATHQVWRETRLVQPEDLTTFESLRLAPVIFQEYIPAVADIRVTIVGDEFFAMAIDSRGTSYEVDFRVSLAEARTGPCELPDDVTSALRLLMKHLGIVYGGVDLRLTPDGEYVFLEVNPAGEFLFAEHGAGLPITDAVAGWLANPR